LLIRYISKKTFFSGRTEPASGRIASALCVRSSRISRAFLPFISCVWCTRTPHFPSTASDALVAAPPPPHASPLYPHPCIRPLVSAPLSSRLLASCLLLAVARVRPPSLLPSPLWRPRSVRFHPLPSAAILCRFFLSLHPTVISIIPLLFTRRLARPPCRPPTLVGFPSHRRAYFRINHPQNSSGRVEAGHFLWEYLS